MKLLQHFFFKEVKEGMTAKLSSDHLSEAKQKRRQRRAQNAAKKHRNQENVITTVHSDYDRWDLLTKWQKPDVGNGRQGRREEKAKRQYDFSIQRIKEQLSNLPLDDWTIWRLYEKIYHDSPACYDRLDAATQDMRAKRVYVELGW